MLFPSFQYSYALLRILSKAQCYSSLFAVQLIMEFFHPFLWISVYLSRYIYQLAFYHQKNQRCTCRDFQRLPFLVVFAAAFWLQGFTSCPFTVQIFLWYPFTATMFFHFLMLLLIILSVNLRLSRPLSHPHPLIRGMILHHRLSRDRLHSRR